MSEKNEWASAGPGGLVAYSVMTYMAAALFLGLVDFTSLLLASGIAFAAIIPYIITAIVSLRKNDNLGGNTFLYFTGFFAAGSGFSWLLTYLSIINHWNIYIRILGYEWIVLSLVLTVTTPGFAKAPLATFLTILTVDPALFITAFYYLGVTNTLINSIGGLLYFITGTLAWYVAAAGMLASVGINLPLGKPLLK
jgi:hypothetical protein